MKITRRQFIKATIAGATLAIMPDFIKKRTHAETAVGLVFDDEGANFAGDWVFAESVQAKRPFVKEDYYMPTFVKG